MHARVNSSRSEEPPDAPTAGRSVALVDRRHGRSLRVELLEGPPSRTDYDVAVYRLIPNRTPRYARVSVHHGHPMRDVSPNPLMTLEGLAGMMMLIDRTSGRGLGFIFFETEDAMLRGDEFVSTAPPGTAGPASSVELYEVLELT